MLTTGAVTLKVMIVFGPAWVGGPAKLKHGLNPPLASPGVPASAPGNVNDAPAIVSAQSSSIDSGKYQRPATFTTQQDHDNMMQQLDIKKLRPGPSGNESAPNHANYDESIANPCPQLPDILTTKNGNKVTTADAWWKQRRPELIEDLEKEVYGRLPKNIPKVTWTAKVIDREFVNRIPIIVKMLVGHVDNSEYPLINVDINMMLVVPANVKGPVPVLMMFSGRPVFPAPAQPAPDEMEKINTAFKELMIKNDPSLKTIFEKYSFTCIVSASITLTPFSFFVSFFE
jgi:hypothetical protein